MSLADALSAHERALQKGGGGPGVANLGLVESAIARPYSGYHRSIGQKAAALVESVAGNHGFTDGNKRTAIILTHLLLARSGYELRPGPGEKDLEAALEQLVLSSVIHEINFDGIVSWFNNRIRRLRR